MLDKQLIKEGQREANFNRIQDTRRRKEAIIQVALKNDQEVHIILAELKNDMADELARHDEPLKIALFGNNKAKHEGKRKIYWEKQLRLEKHRGQTFLMILEQRSQQILD